MDSYSKTNHTNAVNKNIFLTYFGGFIVVLVNIHSFKFLFVMSWTSIF